MGAGNSSAVNKAYEEVLRKLITEDHAKDKKIILDVLNQAPERILSPPANPAIFDEIAKANPGNLLNLLHGCVVYAEKLEESKSSLDTKGHNQFSLVLQIFTTGCLALAHKPEYLKILGNVLLAKGQKFEVESKKQIKNESDDDDDLAPAKKKSKSKKAVESEDEDETPKKGKKGGKKITKEEEKPKKHGKKNKEESEDEDSEDEKPKKRGKRTTKAEPEDEKPKKRGKKAKAEDNDEDEKPKRKTKKGHIEEGKLKKRGKKSTADDSEDDEEEPKPKRRGKKSKVESEDEDSEEEKPKKRGKKLVEEEKPKKRGKKAKEDSDDEESEEEKPKRSRKGRKDDEERPSKKGKKSKVDTDDESEEEKPKKRGKKAADEDEVPKKRGKKHSKADDDESDEEAPKKRSKKGSKEEERQSRKSKKAKVESEDEDSEEEIPKKKSKKSVEEKPSKKSKKATKKAISESDEDSEDDYDYDDEDTEDKKESVRDNMSLLSRFTTAIFKLLFRSGITTPDKTLIWDVLDASHESMSLTRYDLVHTIVGLTNLAAIAQPPQPLPKFLITVPPFRSDLLIASVCKLAASFVNDFNGGTITVYIAEMMKNLFALCAGFATKDPRFGDGFRKVKAEDAIAAFTGSPARTELIFDPTSAFSSASLSFLYLMCLHNPAFVRRLAKDGLSNRFVFDLIYTMQYAFEKVGVCYVHSILVSTLMLILADEGAARALEQPQKQHLLVRFRPHAQTFGDLLLEVALNLAGNESLLPSIVCLYHLIADRVEVSLFATFKLLGLFERVAQQLLDEKRPSEKHRRVVEIFMEAFVKNMQRGINIRVLLVQKAAIFRKLDAADKLSFNCSLAIVVEFLNRAKKAMEKAGKKTMGTEEAVEMFRGFKIDRIIEACRDDTDDYEEEDESEGGELFPPHPHAFAGEMRRTWTEWAEMLVLKAFETEVDLIKAVPV